MRRFFLALLLLFVAAPAMAEGPQYNGACNTITWQANTETDLAGYRLYDRVTTTATPTLIRTYGVQITSATCASLGLNAGQHYLSMRAFDQTGNEGVSSADQPFVLIVDNQISDLRVTVVNATDMTLAWTEVNGGDGAPATMDIRFATPTISWGTAASVTSGTCSSAVAGTTIGATKTCTVTGLSLTTAYQFQGVPYRGTLGSTAVFGPLSNITGATTGGSVPSGTRTTLASDTFPGADGALGSPWMTGYTWDAPFQIPQIVSNAVRPQTAGGYSSVATYATTTTPNDQWARLTLTATQGTGLVFHVVRLRHSVSPTSRGYACSALRNGSGGVISKIVRLDAGTQADLQTTTSGSWANGDQLDCEVQGSTIILSQVVAGVSTPILTANDSTYTSGLTGIGIYSAVIGDGVLDLFEMGGFTAAATDTCGCDQH